MKWLLPLAGAALAGAGWLAEAPAARAAFDCALTTTGQVPLTDLTGMYRGFRGGLYPNGATVRPAAHEALGVGIAERDVRPLDAQGRPDEGGRIVLLSIGMSNTATEFGRFADRIRTDPVRNPRLLVVNGALSSQTADRWRDPTSPAWGAALEQVTRAGATREQVQAAWVKVVLAGFGENTQDPLANFPAFPQALQADLERIARSLRTNFPNVRLVYFSSRIRAYTTPRGLSPEPTAYETGFAVRWAIERQIQGAPELGPDVAPWMSWGPYLWADGLTPRSDGLTYACSDLEADFVHPAAGASTKVADQLKAFFMTDPTTAPWFLKPASGAPSITSITASPPGGDPGVSIGFAAAASDPDGVREYVWTFGDGTFAYGPSPTKVFHVPGQYPVRLAVADQAGNTSLLTVLVDVGGASTSPPGAPRNLRVIRGSGGS